MTWLKVNWVNEMKIKNVNIINFIAGLIGVGSTREFFSAPNGPVDLRHEISQFKGSKQHGCSEVFFPTSGTQRKLEMFGQWRNGKKVGICETYHPKNGLIESRTTFVDDIPHGWHENFDEGGVLLKRELYQNGKVVKFSEK